LRSFQNASSDLALLRSRVVRGSAGPDVATEQWAMLQNIAAARTAFSQPQPPAPPAYPTQPADWPQG
jgi:hypothetical protein